VAAGLAARRPDRVGRLVLYGSYADGSTIASSAVRSSIVSMMRAHVKLGSSVMAQVFIPDGDPEVVRWYDQVQLGAASGEVRASMLDMYYRTEVRECLLAVAAPTLVLHRRNDRAIPFESGRQVAALVPGARMIALEGRWHHPWLGDAGSVLRPIGEFLGLDVPIRPNDIGAPATLTPREAEVLRLVAEGLNDAEIADRLIVSKHTVHRHVANIRTRLAQPSRAAAAAYATRQGLL
jgi:DNA-binding CsgD family transcriptional regulator